MENHLRALVADGWRFKAVDPILLLGIDIGFYLIVEREVTEADDR